MAHVKQGSDEWHTLRNNCSATASKFAAAMGVCTYCSRAKYWRQKTKRQKPDEENDAMRFGTENEDAVRQAYLAIAGDDVSCSEYGFKTLAENPRIGGSPDGICYNAATGETYILEIKCTYPSRVRDEVPISHLAQMIGLCKIFGLNKAHYISWAPNCGDTSYFVSEITWDDAIWDVFMYPALLQFDEYVVSDTPPPRMRSADKQRIVDAFYTHVQQNPCFKCE